MSSTSLLSRGCPWSIYRVSWNTTNHSHMSIFMFSQVKYASYGENWFLQNLTASIQGVTKIMEIKYVIRVHLVMQNCIILGCNSYNNNNNNNKLQMGRHPPGRQPPDRHEPGRHPPSRHPHCINPRGGSGHFTHYICTDCEGWLL
jgi:hypothetical protein